jgi:hypothetical protein
MQLICYVWDVALVELTSQKIEEEIKHADSYLGKFKNANL